MNASSSEPPRIAGPVAHPQIAAELMPDDGQLADLFHRWTPDARDRRRILVDTSARLFDRARN